MAETAGCITVRDIPAADFIAAYAEVLKNNDKFVVPKWADVVKTSVKNELAPYDPDWFFIRTGERYIILLVVDMFFVICHCCGYDPFSSFCSLSLS